MIVLLSACMACSSNSANFQYDEGVPQPDIRIDNLTYGASLDIDQGWYANVTYTLHNYGDASGRVTVEISADHSGALKTEDLFVSAFQTLVKEDDKINIKATDNTIYVRILVNTVRTTQIVTRTTTITVTPPPVIVTTNIVK